MFLRKYYKNHQFKEDEIGREFIVDKRNAYKILVRKFEHIGKSPRINFRARNKELYIFLHSKYLELANLRKYNLILLNIIFGE